MKIVTTILLIPALLLLTTALAAREQTVQAQQEELQRVEYKSMLQEAELARQEAETARRGAVKAAEMARETARLAHKKGLVVMLHLPMQPAHWPEIDPGPGALLVSMKRAEIEQRVRAALDAVPFIQGVNNHMGSRFTEDRERMGWTLAEIKRRDLFFLDSRTSTRSQAYAEARRLNMPSASRSIFLDNIQEPEAIRIQLRKLVAKARHKGRAIGIGHPYAITCQVLKSEYNNLISKVNLVPITNLAH